MPTRAPVRPSDDGSDDELDVMFAALADRTRRAIVAELVTGDRTVNELAEPFAISLQAVSKHIQVLERAGLVSRRREQQRRPCHLELERLAPVVDWVEGHRRVWEARLDQLDVHLRRRVGVVTAGELEVSRVLDASPEAVWEAMLDPEQLAVFWGPPGMSAPADRIVVDARPGGTFEVVMVSDADGQEFPSRSVYVELAAPARLVWRDPATDMTTTTVLTRLGDGRTELRIRQTGIPDGLAPEFLRGGLEGSLDRLADHLVTN